MPVGIRPMGESVKTSTDGDDGIGLELLKAMREANVCDRLWIATRTCKQDYVHIGKKRFEHSINACTAANTTLS